MNSSQKYKWPIIAISIVIPLVVGGLFRVKITGVNTSFLPPIYAAINGLTAVLLITAVYLVKTGKRSLHEKLMKLCLLLSLAFLVLYVIYHMTSDHTLFADFDGDGLRSASESERVGPMLLIYQVLLSSHIILSMVIVPLVLFTVARGISNEHPAHKKIARFTFPIWLYVAVSGVVVFLMISPFYK